MTETPRPDIHINMGREPKPLDTPAAEPVAELERPEISSTVGRRVGDVALSTETEGESRLRMRSRQPTEPEPTEGESRLRINSSVGRRTEEAAEAEPSDTPDLEAISLELTGREQHTVEDSLAMITDSSLGDLIEKYGGYQHVLSGEVAEMTGKYSLNGKARADHRYDTNLHGPKPFKNGLSQPWETGVNIGELVEKNPDGRFKFYLSLDLSTPEKEASAEEFMKRVYEKAAEAKIAMLTKTESHTYDACDLYTWSPVEMGGIIQDLYEEFPDIWLTSEHPLQGTLEGVDAKHVGFVQEPIGGLEGDAHSSRMGKIGKFIDEARSVGKKLTPELFEKACAVAGVRSEAPWLIAEDRKGGYAKRNTVTDR